MTQDPDECLVHCNDCNAYLYAISRYEPPSRAEPAIAIKCPYKRKKNSDGTFSNEIPEGEQRYGRS